MIVSETYEVHDYIFYDSGATDRTSVYDTTYLNSGSLTYDSTNQCYNLSANQGNRRNVMLPTTTNGGVCIEADIEAVPSNTSSFQDNIGFDLFNSDISKAMCNAFVITHYSAKEHRVGEHSNTTSVNTEGGTSTTISSLQRNKWYHIVLEVTSNTTISKLYDGDTLLDTRTTNTNISLTNCKVFIYHYASNSTSKFKNIKVKPL